MARATTRKPKTIIKPSKRRATKPLRFVEGHELNELTNIVEALIKRADANQHVWQAFDTRMTNIEKTILEHEDAVHRHGAFIRGCAPSPRFDLEVVDYHNLSNFEYCAVTTVIGLVRMDKVRVV